MNAKISCIDYPFNEHSHRSKIFPENDCLEKLSQEYTRTGEITLAETSLRQMPSENRNEVVLRGRCLMQMSSRNSLANEAVMGTKCQIPMCSQRRNRPVNKNFGSSAPTGI